MSNVISNRISFYVSFLGGEERFLGSVDNGNCNCGIIKEAETETGMNSNRIRHGEMVKEPYELPWVVAIVIKSSNDPLNTAPDKEEIRCTGALLDSTHVLTAAHCLTPTKRLHNESFETHGLHVFLGSNKWIHPYASSPVSKIDIHPSVNDKYNYVYRSFGDGKNIVKLRQGSGKDRQGMALKAKGLKA